MKHLLMMLLNNKVFYIKFRIIKIIRGIKKIRWIKKIRRIKKIIRIKKTIRRVKEIRTIKIIRRIKKITWNIKKKKNWRGWIEKIRGS